VCGNCGLSKGTQVLQKVQAEHHSEVKGPVQEAGASQEEGGSPTYLRSSVCCKAKGCG
jgi:hypothetical protein